MAAITNPNSAPGEQNTGASRGGRPIWLKLLFFIFLIAFGGAIIWWVNRPAPTLAAAPTTVKTAKAEFGDIEHRLRIVGQTTARNFANISGPRLAGPEGGRDMVILKMVASGSIVKAGDVVAELDPQSLKDHLDDTRDGLRDRDNSLKKKQIQQELDMENLDQSLRVARAQLDKARLDFKAEEVRTVVDRELLKLSVEEAEAQFKQISAELPLRQQSQKSDLRISTIDRDLEVQHVQRHEQDLLKYVIHAPIDGMVIVETLNRPGGERVQIAEGDRVTPGQPFMKVVETARMMVDCTVNQTESSLFRLGQQAHVNLDAFPGARYEGKIDSIGALASGGRFQNYYVRSLPVRVIMSTTDSRVIPDLTASADVLLERLTGVVTVPAAALRTDKDKTYVEVKGPKGFERREVKAGLNNGVRVAILEGLKQGEEVRIN